MSRSPESISQDRGHSSISSIIEGPSHTFNPAQGDRRPKWKDNFCESHHPSDSLWENCLWRPQEAGRKKGLQGQNLPWAALIETGLRQGLRLTLRQETPEQYSKSLDSFPTSLSLHTFLLWWLASEKFLLPRWWWRCFGTFISKTLNARLKTQLWSRSSLRRLLHPLAKQLQSVIKTLAVTTYLHL